MPAPQDEHRLSSNRKVLEAIRRAEPVSRTELVRLTGLGAATISEITAELLSHGMLTEKADAPTGRGRPPVRLGLNAGAGHAVGAVVMVDGTVAVQILNLRGDKLFERLVTGTANPPGPAMAEALADAIEETIAAGPVPKTQIHGVGVVVPGMVDRFTGMVHWLPPYQPEVTPIADHVQARLGLPVIMGNSFNAFACAEHWFAAPEEADDFTLVFVGFGFGLTEYVGGALVSGSHGVNPEIAHVKVTGEGGRLCMCGARGCLWTYSSIFGIVAEVRDLPDDPWPDFEKTHSAFLEIVDEAKAGDQKAREAFDIAGSTLGRAIANYINLRCPSRIIIVVQEVAIEEMVRPAFEAALAADTLPTLLGSTEIRFRPHGELPYYKGAAAMVLDQVYSAPKAAALALAGAAGAGLRRSGRARA